MLFKFISNFYIRLKFLVIVQNFVISQVYKLSWKSILKKHVLTFLYLFLSFLTSYSKVMNKYFRTSYMSHWFKTSTLFFMSNHEKGSFHARTYYSAGPSYAKLVFSKYDFFHHKYAISQSKVKFFKKTFKKFVYFANPKFSEINNNISVYELLPYLGCFSKVFCFSYLKFLIKKKHKSIEETILKKFLIKNRFYLRYSLNNMVLSFFSQLNFDLRLHNLKKKFKKFVFKSVIMDVRPFDYLSPAIKQLGFHYSHLHSSNLLFSLRAGFVKRHQLGVRNKKYIKFRATILFKRFNLRLPKKKKILKINRIIVNKKLPCNKKDSFLLKKPLIYKESRLLYYRGNSCTNLVRRSYPTILLTRFYRAKLLKLNYKRLKRLIKKKKSIFKRKCFQTNYLLTAFYYFYNLKKKPRHLLTSKQFLTQPYKLQREKILFRQNKGRFITKKNKKLFDLRFHSDDHLLTVLKDIGYPIFYKRYGILPDKYNSFYRNQYHIYKRKFTTKILKKLNKKFQFAHYHRIKFRSGFRLNTYKFYIRILWRLKHRADKPLPTHMHMGYLKLDIRDQQIRKLGIKMTHTFVNFIKRYQRFCRNSINPIYDGSYYLKRFIRVNFLTVFAYRTYKSAKLNTRVFVRKFNLSKHWRRIVQYEKNTFISKVKTLQNQIAYYKNFYEYYSPSLFVFDSSMFTPILRSGKSFALEKILYNLQLSSFINNLDIYKYWRKLMFLFDRSVKTSLKTFGHRKILKKTIIYPADVPLSTRLHSLYSDVYHLKEKSSVDKFLRFIFKMKKTNERQYYISMLMSLDVDFDFAGVYRKYRIAKAKEMELLKKKKLKDNNK